MRLGPSCALWGVCLILMASGCAGPARREGLATTGAGTLPVRLFRPADPIARLSPAPVSVGPLGDPGSYTAAGVPEMSRSGSVGAPLTVGGGQLASRGNTPSGNPRSRATPDRPSLRLARSEPLRNGPVTQPSPDDGPRQPSSSGEGLFARLIGRTEPAFSQSERIEGRSEGLALRPRESGPTPDIETDQPPLMGPESELISESELENATPILAEGIDLETYAAPPIASDPDAQLASTRRPMPALSNARDLLRSVSEETVAESSSESPTEPIAVSIPDLPEVFPEDPFATESDDPVQGDQPTKADRDDEEVRPTSVHPEELASERLRDQGDPSATIKTPSPFEPTRLTERLGMRMRRLRERLTPNVVREDRSIDSGSNDARGFPRLFRRQHDETR
ncbi:hypothetical protein [Tautonia rosea]|uniref:hypothetical protein n=1 Tax=Tautonia rosea TaxID=2728037 RepID=UPI001472E267|nr:hypothetical protein [Tautonia rosea]